MNMYKRYLLSSVAFDAEKEQGTPPVKTSAEMREEQRKEINVVSTNDDEAEKKEEIKEPAEEEKEVVQTKEDDVEEKEEQIEASEKTEEQLETEKLEAKSQKEKDRIQRRIDKEVSRRKTLETENAELKRQLEAKDKDGPKLTEEDVEKRANVKAAAKVEADEFNAACMRLSKEGAKVDKEFASKVIEMGKEIAPIPVHMIGILDDLDNGGAVLSFLANNHDDYEDLIPLSPARMAVRLAKLSDKIETEAKVAAAPKPKVISKVPPANEAINSNGRGSKAVLSDTQNTEDWMATRNRQVAEARAAGRRNLY